MKGEWIVKVFKIIFERYGGKVLDDIYEFMKFLGIGRKCVNIVLVYGFGK